MATRVGSSKGYSLFIREGSQLLRASSADENVRRAITLARKMTKRRKVLNIVPVSDVRSNRRMRISKNFVTIYTNSISQFCMALASSEDRIAAVVVAPDESDPRNKMFLREVRELTSAEGALLIWRAPVESTGGLQYPPEFSGIKPDITCYQDQNNAAS